MLTVARSPRILAILASLVVVCAVDGAEPSTVGDQLRSLTPEQLVERLGARQFQVRQAAEQRLLDLGTSSFSAVRSGMESSEAEIAFRANRVMRNLQVLATAQNEERLLDAPWTVNGDLALVWEAWQATVGDSPGSRKLLVQALRNEPELLLSLNSSRVSRRTLFENQCGELKVFSAQQSSSAISPVSVAALVFIALQEDTQPSSNATYVIGNQINTGSFMSLLDEPTVGTATRTLVDRWILHAGLSTPIHRLSLSGQIRSSAGLSVAQELLNTGGQPFLQGVYYVIRHGSQEDMELLEAKLDDDSPFVVPIHNTGAMELIQLRDLALIGLIQMARQSPSEYGIENAPQENQPLLKQFFSNNHDREVAINKWRIWSREHMREIQPVPTDASEGVSL